MGNPPKKSTSSATVIINIKRNQNEPRFTNLPADITIEQTAAVDERVFSVEARDQDRNEPFNLLYYEIIGDDSATNYFKINEVGEILVRNDLRGAPGDEIEYQVSIFS